MLVEIFLLSLLTPPARFLLCVQKLQSLQPPIFGNCASDHSLAPLAPTGARDIKMQALVACLLQVSVYSLEAFETLISCSIRASSQTLA
jgi:hypothetical protein